MLVWDSLQLSQLSATQDSAVDHSTSSLVMIPLSSWSGGASTTEEALPQEEDFEEMLTPCPLQRYKNTEVEEAEALWRIKLREPPCASPINGLERHGHDAAPVRSSPVCRTTQRLFHDANTRRSAQRARALEAAVEKMDAEMVQCTFKPRTNHNKSRNQADATVSAAPTVSRAPAREFRGEALFRQHAAKLSRQSAEIHRADVEAVVHPRLSKHTERLTDGKESCEKSTHMWEERRQERIISARRALEEKERVENPGTPSLCMKSRALDDLRRGASTRLPTTPRSDSDSHVSPGPACSPLSRRRDVTSSPTRSTPLAGFSSVNTPITSSSVMMTAARSPQHIQRCHSLHQQALLQHDGRMRATQRADAVALALSDVRVHVAHLSATTQSNHRDAPTSATAVTTMDVDFSPRVHERLYEQAQSCRLKEQWDTARGHAASLQKRNQFSSPTPPQRRRSNPTDRTSDDTIVVYEL